MRTVAMTLALLIGCTAGTIGGPVGDGDDDTPAGAPDAGPGPSPDPDPGAPDAQPAVYTMAIAPATANLRLDSQAELQIDLQSSFDGPVTLAVEGLPESWQVAITPSATLQLTAGQLVSAAISIDVPSDGEARQALMQVVATAGGAGERRSQAVVTVENRLVISIPSGTANGIHPFPAPIQIRLGAEVSIANDDIRLHRIHSDNDGAGFPHQPDAMSQGDSHDFTIERTGSYDYYCHEHQANVGIGQIVVVEP